MNIRLDNYEEYLVRLVEGDLSESEQLEVQAFLDANPELKMELEAFRSAIIVPDKTVHFPGKRNLLQPEHSELIVRYIEKDLNQNELLLFHKQLKKDSSMQKELELFQRTILLPDSAVVFPDKESLKRSKGGRLIPMYVRYISVAAVAATLLLLFLLKGTEQVNSPQAEPNLAENTSGEISNDETMPGDVDNSAANKNQSTTSEELQKYIERRPLLSSNRKEAVQPSTVSTGTREILASINPLKITSADQISFERKIRRAPVLVPYHEEEIRQQPVGQNTFSSPLLSIASVVGSELLRLSGREGWLNPDGAAVQKVKGPIKFSFETKKFSLRHTFRKNKK